MYSRLLIGCSQVCHSFINAVINCGTLQNPENGMATVTETTFGSTANYSCSGSNYLLVGAAERTCLANGMWSGSAPECGTLLVMYYRSLHPNFGQETGMKWVLDGRNP